MNRLDFIIFLVIYMTIVGLVCACFNAGSYNQPFSTTESQVRGYGDKDPSILDQIINALTTVAKAIGFFFNFILNILTFNIPGVPLILRGIMVAPIYVVSFVLLADYIRGINSS